MAMMEPYREDVFEDYIMSGSQPAHLEQYLSMSTWPWRVWRVCREFVPDSQHLWLWGTFWDSIPWPSPPGPACQGHAWLPQIPGHRDKHAILLPLMASFTAESTGSMFFCTSSSGPGRRAIFSLRSSASLALFSFIWAAGMDLSGVEAEQGRGRNRVSSTMPCYFWFVAFVTKYCVTWYILKSF